MAPVGTIHSLCRRILSDYPFESGSGFQLGEMVASDALLDEWSADLWRQLQQGEQAVPAAPSSLAALRRLLKAYLQPGVALWAPDAAAARRRAAGRAGRRAGGASLHEKAHFLPRKTALKNALLALAAWLRERGEPLKASVDRQPARRRERCRRAVAARRAGCQRGHAGRAGLRRARGASARIRGRGGRMCRPGTAGSTQVQAWRELRLAARGQLTFDELIARVGARAAARRPRTGRSPACRLAGGAGRRIPGHRRPAVRHPAGDLQRCRRRRARPAGDDRRPQAGDLPLPRRRHPHLPARGRCCRRSAAAGYQSSLVARAGRGDQPVLRRGRPGAEHACRRADPLRAGARQRPARRTRSTPSMARRWRSRCNCI